jgi:hypothetical protein
MAAPKRRRPPSRQYTLPLRWVAVVRENAPAVLGGTPTLLPGYLCETCLDAPATVLVPAPWGGEMGVCRACQRHQAAARDEEATAARASGDQERAPDE